MMPKIDQGIPPPAPKPRTGFTALIRSLKVGESVLLPVPTWKANAIAYRALGQGNYRSEKGPDGVRIWRVG